MDISFTKLPWYGQVATFVVLALTALAAFRAYYEAPLRSDMAARKSKLESLTRDISNGEATARKVPEYRAEVDDLERLLGALRSELPEEKDLAELLRRLESDALESNLMIKRITPSPVVTRQLYAELPIELELEGTYHNLAAFFDRLGRFRRIVNISGLEVRGKDRPEPNLTVTARCVATTFILLAPVDTGEAPADQPTTNGM